MSETGSAAAPVRPPLRFDAGPAARWLKAGWNRVDADPEGFVKKTLTKGGRRLAFEDADERAEALEKRDQNRENWLALDPAVKCYMPGIPRANYMPFPFQIVQTPEHVLIAYEFASASRVIYMNREGFEAPFDTWMGHSIGRWEGETLVVDVTSQVPDTWLDSSGNHHTDAIHVEERWTAMSPYHLQYEATITDENVYSQPWKVSLPLYRRVDPNMQLLEFKCVEFAEELMYGHLRKDADSGP